MQNIEIRAIIISHKSLVKRHRKSNMTFSKTATLLLLKRCEKAHLLSVCLCFSVNNFRLLINKKKPRKKRYLKHYHKMYKIIIKIIELKSLKGRVSFYPCVFFSE